VKQFFLDEIAISNNVNAHPNPFSTSTTIEYELAQPKNVSITIFNHLGQQIERIDQENNQSGMQQYIWDASEITSGVYFVQVRIGKEMTTRKIVKMK